jgi:hypothetical protein
MRAEQFKIAQQLGLETNEEGEGGGDISIGVQIAGKICLDVMNGTCPFDPLRKKRMRAFNGKVAPSPA